MENNEIVIGVEKKTWIRQHKKQVVIFAVIFAIVVGILIAIDVVRQVQAEIQNEEYLEGQAEAVEFMTRPIDDPMLEVVPYMDAEKGFFIDGYVSSKRVFLTIYPYCNAERAEEYVQNAYAWLGGKTENLDDYIVEVKYCE